MSQKNPATDFVGVEVFFTWLCRRPARTLSRNNFPRETNTGEFAAAAGAQCQRKFVFVEGDFGRGLHSNSPVRITNGLASGVACLRAAHGDRMIRMDAKFFNQIEFGSQSFVDQLKLDAAALDGRGQLVEGRGFSEELALLEPLLRRVADEFRLAAQHIPQARDGAVERGLVVPAQ